MKLEKIVSFAAAAAVVLGTFPQALAQDGADYGTINVMSDGSSILNFGTDSIILNGNMGYIITYD